MIAEEMLPHVVTLATAAEITDSRGDTRESWDNPDRETVKGWLQQNTRTEDHLGGDRLTGGWLLITNTPVDGRQRVEWDGMVFLVDGPPAPVHTPQGLHHYETTLKLVEG